MEENNRGRVRFPDAARIIAVPCPVPDPWREWDFKGNYFVGPGGVRIHRQRMLGLAWRYEMELKRAGYASQQKADAGKRRSGLMPRVKVIIVDLQDYRENGIAAA